MKNPYSTTEKTLDRNCVKGMKELWEGACYAAIVFVNEPYCNGCRGVNCVVYVL